MELEEIFEKLKDILGVPLKDMELFINALTHPSRGSISPPMDQERLEFLGDAVLELSISTILFENFPEYSEGELTKLRAELVNRFTLSEIMKELGLDKLVLLGKGEEEDGGREKVSVLSDTFERIIGALFLERGFEKTLEVIKKLFGKRLQMGLEEQLRDWKSMLQEFSQRNYGRIPTYKVLSETGSPHSKVYEVSVEVGGMCFRGKGSSKKLAEKDAAYKALKTLRRGECQE